MNYLGPNSDAKDIYQQNSSADSHAVVSTAVEGNLSDLMRNATLPGQALHAWTKVIAQPTYGTWPASRSTL